MVVTWFLVIMSTALLTVATEENLIKEVIRNVQ